MKVLIIPYIILNSSPRFQDHGDEGEDAWHNIAAIQIKWARQKVNNIN